ncbi:hypothetical protein CVS40_9971 [Lucilia cuprina]|nr:hypothetical protein CVS40_9971 [Lucilia cuprina]
MGSKRPPGKEVGKLTTRKPKIPTTKKKDKNSKQNNNNEKESKKVTNNIYFPDTINIGPLMVGDLPRTAGACEEELPECVDMIQNGLPARG